MSQSLEQQIASIGGSTQSEMIHPEHYCKADPVLNAAGQLVGVTYGDIKARVKSPVFGRFGASIEQIKDVLLDSKQGGHKEDYVRVAMQAAKMSADENVIADCKRRALAALVKKHGALIDPNATPQDAAAALQQIAG